MGLKKIVNPHPVRRKDTLASGHATEDYGNSGIKVTQSEWDRIFGPTPSNHKVAKERKKS